MMKRITIILLLLLLGMLLNSCQDRQYVSIKSEDPLIIKNITHMNGLCKYELVYLNKPPRHSLYMKSRCDQFYSGQVIFFAPIEVTK